MSNYASEPSIEPVSMDTLDAREHGAFEVMEEMCRATGLEVRPEPRGRHVPYLDIELVGPDAADTLGRHGHTLDAFQYLANLIIGRRVGPEVRVILDAGDYRARRAETLIQLAADYAKQVKELQQECELDPLPAHERRIIHNALSGDPEIRTYSEGDDPDRRVIIAPK